MPAIQHVFKSRTPTGCFVSGGGELFVSTPEFCYLQMASQLSLVELIELGYELCGTYSMPAGGGSDSPTDVAYNCAPLTHKKQLKAFAERMPGVKGYKKVVRALRYIQDGSASPMETRLTILLTLPYKLGGYSFLMPELNSHIIPNKVVKRFSSKMFYSCDLFWAGYNLAVEYDSNLFHTGSGRIANDSKKRNTLASIGVTTITVTSQQIQSATEFEKVARILARNMGKRLVFKNPEFSTAHDELRKQLLLSNYTKCDLLIT